MTTKTPETILAALKDLADAKKARVQKFHEDLQKLYDVKREDINGLRAKEAELLAELKAAKKAKPEVKAPAKAKAPKAKAEAKKAA